MLLYVGVFSAAYIRCATMEKAVNGFRATGIFPFNPDVYSDDDFAPSLATEQPLCTPTEPSSAPNKSSSTAAETSAPMEPSSAPAETSSVLNEPSSASAEPSLPPIEPSSALTETSSVLNEPSCRVSVTEISPLPKVMHVGPRKRKAQKAEILTSSPFKRQLEEVKQKKLELEQARSRRLEKKNQKEKFERKSVKETKQKPTKKPANNRMNTKTKKSADTVTDRPNEQYFCLYCHELFVDPPTEDWIQCNVCKKWAHESCAPADGPDFCCDFCA